MFVLIYFVLFDSVSDTLTMTQVITGLAPTPPIKLRVVNSTGDEVRGVELGDPLFLKVEMLDESKFFNDIQIKLLLFSTFI